MVRDFRHNKRRLEPDKKRPSRPVTPGELMDPLLYIGGLDAQKYPILPLEKERKPREDVENPLNKR